jgi:protein-disulfide isomerase
MRSSAMRRAGRLRVALDVISTIAMTIASAVLIVAVVVGGNASTTEKTASGRRSLPAKPLPQVPISLAGIPMVGQLSAKIVVLEYSDFECPYCYRFAVNTLPAIRTQYVDSGKIRFGFRQLPLEGKHRDAVHAASAALCAHTQGRFWPMHDALFTEPKAVDPVSIMAKATRIGLDVAQFQTCLSGDGEVRVRKEMAEAKAFEINGTPTFLFGTVRADGQLAVTRRESGAIPAKAFADILEGLLTGGRAGTP